MDIFKSREFTYLYLINKCTLLFKYINNDIQKEIISDIKIFINKLQQIFLINNENINETKKDKILEILIQYLEKIIEEKIYNLLKIEDKDEIIIEIDKKALLITQNNKKIHLKDILILEENKENDLDLKIKSIYIEVEKNVINILDNFFKNSEYIHRDFDIKFNKNIEVNNIFIENKLKTILKNEYYEKINEDIDSLLNNHNKNILLYIQKNDDDINKKIDIIKNSYSDIKKNILENNINKYNDINIEINNLIKNKTNEIYLNTDLIIKEYISNINNIIDIKLKDIYSDILKNKIYLENKIKDIVNDNILINDFIKNKIDEINIYIETTIKEYIINTNNLFEQKLIKANNDIKEYILSLDKLLKDYINNNNSINNNIIDKINNKSNEIYTYIDTIFKNYILYNIKNNDNIENKLKEIENKININNFNLNFDKENNINLYYCDNLIASTKIIKDPSQIIKKINFIDNKIKIIVSENNNIYEIESENIISNCLKTVKNLDYKYLIWNDLDIIKINENNNSNLIFLKSLSIGDKGMCLKENSLNIGNSICFNNNSLALGNNSKTLESESVALFGSCIGKNAFSYRSNNVDENNVQFGENYNIKNFNIISKEINLECDILNIKSDKIINPKINELEKRIILLEKKISDIFKKNI